MAISKILTANQFRWSACGFVNLGPVKEYHFAAHRQLNKSCLGKLLQASKKFAKMSDVSCEYIDEAARIRVRQKLAMGGGHDKDVA
jgi:hypothetical protein